VYASRLERSDVRNSEARDSSRGAARIELILYVSAASPASARGRQRPAVAAAISERPGSLTVCDLTVDPSCGEANQIAFTPTLCKRQPTPPMWILGDLSHPEPLLELLEFYGVETAHGDR
jgi:KaiB domain